LNDEEMRKGVWGGRVVVDTNETLERGWVVLYIAVAVLTQACC
jgi:hypothetical protein